MEYIGKTFENVALDLDGNDFLRCHFKKVTFRYGGGITSLVECHFYDPFRLTFVGALAESLDGIRRLYHDMGPGAVEAAANSMSDFFRQPPPRRKK